MIRYHVRLCALIGALLRLRREDEAIEQLSAVLQPADVQYNLASTYEQMGKKAEARIAYRKALELQPDRSDIREALEQAERSDG